MVKLKPAPYGEYFWVRYDQQWKPYPTQTIIDTFKHHGITATFLYEKKLDRKFYLQLEDTIVPKIQWTRILLHCIVYLTAIPLAYLITIWFLCI